MSTNFSVGWKIFPNKGRSELLFLSYWEKKNPKNLSSQQNFAKALFIFCVSISSPPFYTPACPSPIPTPPLTLFSVTVVLHDLWPRCCYCSCQFSVFPLLDQSAACDNWQFSPSWNTFLLGSWNTISPRCSRNPSSLLHWSALGFPPTSLFYLHFLPKWSLLPLLLLTPSITDCWQT